MSGTIRDDEYALINKAVNGCIEEGGPGEILDRVLSVVEDILEAREEPIRELCREWATNSVELSEGLGFVIRVNAEQQCASAIFELLNEWTANEDMDCDELEELEEDIEEDTEPV